MKNDDLPIEDKIKQIDRKLKLAPFLDYPGVVMFALGLYGRFVVKGEAVIPWLNESKNVTQLLVAGGVWLVWGIYNHLTLLRQKSKLQKELANK